MKLILILSALLLFIVGFIMPNKKEIYQPSRAEQLVNMTLGKTAKAIKEKYNLTPVGEGAAMPGGPIRALHLSFNTSNRYTKEKLRELVINCANEMLFQVHTNAEIQQFIYEPPFTIKNIQIAIFNHEKDGRGVRDPDISVAAIYGGIITYKTIDPNDRFRYKNICKETYEEALQVLQNK